MTICMRCDFQGEGTNGFMVFDGGYLCNPCYAQLPFVSADRTDEFILGLYKPVNVQNQQHPQWYIDVKKMIGEPTWYVVDVKHELVTVWYLDEIMYNDIQVDWQEAVVQLGVANHVFNMTYTSEELGRDEYLSCLLILLKDESSIEQVKATIDRVFKEVDDALQMDADVAQQESQ